MYHFSGAIQTLRHCRKEAFLQSSTHVCKYILHACTHGAQACVLTVCENMNKKLRAGDYKNKGRDTTNEIKQPGGTKAERSEK